jgi:phytoene desaturase
VTKKAVVIGSGFAGLSAACFLAKAGFDVTVLEKQSTAGGRARQLSVDNFNFDMGPSWYWMPDVFENFFAQFDKKTSDYYNLKRLSPSYRIYWENGFDDIPSDYNELKNLFESWERGAAENLDIFLKEAAYKYNVGMNKLVHKPGRSITEFVDKDVLFGIFRMDLFTSIKKHIAKYFKDERIRQLLEFPVLFLGALPAKTPALYSLMNYADIIGGTWYPEGGMISVVNAMQSLATSLGVKFCFNENVNSVSVTGKKINEVITDNNRYTADVVVGGADYHHIETKILPPAFRTYSDQYWNSRVMAPGCLLFYVGINKKLKNVLHHSLFFDRSFAVHGDEIYNSKIWPTEPLFYVSATSVSDESAAPTDHENLFFLIPVASGLMEDTELLRKKYFDKIISRFESATGEQITENIVVYRSFGLSDFMQEYNAFKGNAYGLANTLMQTAILKPSCKSKKLDNLFYTGQLTVPGPGVPPALISGQLVAGEILKQMKRREK